MRAGKGRTSRLTERRAREHLIHDLVVPPIPRHAQRPRRDQVALIVRVGRDVAGLVWGAVRGGVRLAVRAWVVAW